MATSMVSSLPQELSNKGSSAPQKEPGRTEPGEAALGPAWPLAAPLPQPLGGCSPPRSRRRQRVRAAAGRAAPRGRAGRAGTGRVGASRALPPRLKGGAGDARGHQAQPACLPPEGALHASLTVRSLPLRRDRGWRAGQSGLGTGTHRPHRRPQPALRPAPRSRYRRRHFARTRRSQRERMRETAANGAAARGAWRERPIVV